MVAFKVVGYVMTWLRKHWYLFAAVLLFVIGVREWDHTFNKRPSIRVRSNTTSASPSELVQAKPGDYNFTRMLALIEKTEIIKQQFKDLYRGYPSRHYKPIDMQKTRELLSDLYRERIRFNQYFLAEKVEHQGQIPEKRRRTLEYYQGVIDECIKDIEKILRQV
jgi:hypothetical protein